jgi:hypothetical protein
LTPTFGQPSLARSAKGHKLTSSRVPLDVRFSSWSRKNALASEVAEKPGPGRSQATIAVISCLVPTMFVTRVRL